VAGTRSALAFGLDTGRRLAENVAEYLLEEQPVLMRPGAIADWSADVVELRNDVERLLKRIEKIETKLSAGAAAASAPSAKLDKQ
jgi:ubiquinone biosynthesis protein UbiJ